MKKAVALLILFILSFTFISCKQDTQGTHYFNFSEENKVSRSQTIFKSPTFTISFVTNINYSVDPIKVPEIVNSLPAPQADNKKFMGWYLDEDLYAKAELPLELTEDIILYGKWIDEYTLKFEPNGGKSIASIKVTDTVQYLPTPTRQGYQFDGWYYDGAFKQKATAPLTIQKNTTLYAKWIKQYTVSFFSNGGTEVNEIITLGNILSEPQTSKNEHLFDGWYFDSTFGNKASFPLHITKDTTLYAKWIRTTYTATCNNVKIKDWDKSYNSKICYNISTNKFDIKALEEKGYKINISISYDVYYEKDYDVLFDVGYVGAPRYEIYLENASGKGSYEEDIKTTKSSVTKNISYTYPASSLTHITLTFSTNNKQNIIHFENIKVTYTCIK